MHLRHDPFGFGVHALGPAVVVWQGHGRVHGFFVQVEAAGEGVQVGRSVARTAAIHSSRRPGLPWRGVQAADLFSREANGNGEALAISSLDAWVRYTRAKPGHVQWARSERRSEAHEIRWSLAM